MAKLNPRLRTWYKTDLLGQPIPGTLTRRLKPPQSGRTGNWIELPNNVCCTTTTTTTSTTTTTTTTP